MVLRPSTNATEVEHDAAFAEERRGAMRARAVFRVALVRAREDEGLARIRNISDGGMRLTIGIAVRAGDPLDISFSDTLLLKAQVAWVNQGECGVQFARSIDSVAALRLTAEEAQAGKARPHRLSTVQPVLVVSERGRRRTQLSDVSLRGMKILNDGDLTPGLAVAVSIGGGKLRRGYVRWIRDNSAGLILTEPFAVEELGSVSALKVRDGICSSALDQPTNIDDS